MGFETACSVVLGISDKSIWSNPMGFETFVNFYDDLIYVFIWSIPMGFETYADMRNVIKDVDLKYPYGIWNSHEEVFVYTQ